MCPFPAQPVDVESKTRTYHGRVGSGRRTAGRLGRAGLDRTLTDRFAQETTVPRASKASKTNCPEQLFRSTSNGNIM